ncbi:MAG: hypothetical protein ACK5YA_00975, partial [bacterium]
LNYKVNKTVFQNSQQVISSKDNENNEEKANNINLTNTLKKSKKRTISEFKKDSIYEILSYKPNNNNSKLNVLNKTSGASFKKSYSIERNNTNISNNLNVVKNNKIVQISDANGFSIIDGNKNSILNQSNLNQEKDAKRDRSFANLKNNSSANLKIYKLTKPLDITNQQEQKSEVGVQTNISNEANRSLSTVGSKKSLKYSIERSRDIIAYTYISDENNQRVTSKKMSVLLKEHMMNKEKLNAEKEKNNAENNLVKNIITTDTENQPNNLLPKKQVEPIKLRSFSQKRIILNSNNNNQIKDIIEGKYSKLIKSED